jgi:methylase of polypeptide subunit release factors
MEVERNSDIICENPPFIPFTEKKFPYNDYNMACFSEVMN